MKDTERILKLYELWNQTEGSVLAVHVDNALSQSGIATFNQKMEKLAEITGEDMRDTYTWIVDGKHNIKIPFLQLCMVADFFEMSVMDFLVPTENIYEHKFAVVQWIATGTIKVLKFFGEDEKEAALAVGAEYAKTTDSVIHCVLASFNQHNQMKNGECRIYEVWNALI